MNTLSPPDPEGCFPRRSSDGRIPDYTYSDDFSYYAAGVPSTVNGFLLQKDRETVFPSTLTSTTVNTTHRIPTTKPSWTSTSGITAPWPVHRSNSGPYLDFTAQYDRILVAMNEPLMAESGVDTAAFQAAWRS